MGHFLDHFGDQANDVEIALLHFFFHDPVAREGPDNVVIRAFRQFSFHLGKLHDRITIGGLAHTHAEHGDNGDIISKWMGLTAA